MPKKTRPVQKFDLSDDSRNAYHESENYSKEEASGDAEPAQVKEASGDAEPAQVKETFEYAFNVHVSAELKERFDAIVNYCCRFPPYRDMTSGDILRSAIKLGLDRIEANLEAYYSEDWFDDADGFEITVLHPKIADSTPAEYSPAPVRGRAKPFGVQGS